MNIDILFTVWLAYDWAKISIKINKPTMNEHTLALYRHVSDDIIQQKSQMETQLKTILLVFNATYHNCANCHYGFDETFTFCSVRVQKSG